MTNEQAQLIISLLQQLNKTLVEVERLEKFIVGELQKAAKDEFTKTTEEIQTT